MFYWSLIKHYKICQPMSIFVKKKVWLQSRHGGVKHGNRAAYGTEHVVLIKDGGDG